MKTNQNKRDLIEKNKTWKMEIDENLRKKIR